MSRRVRIIVNVLAWLTFIAIAPFLISYSMGHRITPTQPNPVAVGTFLIRTIPNGASILLNGEKLGSKTPNSVQDLLPGSYSIELQKEEYRTWKKSLPITGTMVTDLSNTRLIPKTIEEDVVRGNVTDFFISPKRRWLVVKEPIKKGYQMRIVRFKNYDETGKIININIGNGESTDIVWSPSEDNFILVVVAQKNTKNYLINTSTGISKIISGENVKIIGWTTSLTEEKLLEIKNKKLLISPLTGGGSETISEAIIDAKSNGGDFAILESGTDTYRIKLFSQSGNEKDEIILPDLKNNTPDNLLLSPSGDIVVLTQPNQHLIVWDNSDRVWHSITDHAENISWSPDGEKISWQESEFDLWVMNIHEKRSPLKIYAPELITRLSTPIRNITWFAGSQHLLFYEKDVIKIADLDHRDSHRIESLISTNSGDSKMAVIQNGDEIIATVRRKNTPVLSRFFMLAKEDR